MVDTIALAAQAGVPPVQAAAALGVSREKFNRWLRDGRDPAVRGRLREQVDRIEAAEMRAAERILAQLYTAARGGHVVKRSSVTTQRRDGSVVTRVDEVTTTPDWRGFAWMLERRWPEEFKRSAPTIQADVGEQQEGEVTPEALRAKVSNIFDQMERRRTAREAHEAAHPVPGGNGAVSPNGQPS